MAKLIYSTGVDEVSPDPLEYEIAFIDEDNTSPLIWFDQYPKTIKEHDPLNLYFMVYDPSAISNPTVRRYVNGVELPTLDENLGYNNTKWHRWSISNYRVGKNTFALQCGTTTREITINVEKDLVRNLNIYSGNDDQITPVLSVGGIGVISVLSNICPKLAHDIPTLYSPSSPDTCASSHCTPPST